MSHSVRALVRNKFGWLILAIAYPCVPAHTAQGESHTLSPQFEIKLSDRGALLVPHDNLGVGDYFLLYSQSHVRAWSSQDGKMLGTVSDEFSSPPRWIGTVGNRFLLASLFEIMGHRLGEPAESWIIVKSKQQSNPDPEDNNPIRHVVAEKEKVVALFGDGQVKCLNVATGESIWQQALDPKPVGAIAIERDTATYLTRAERGETVHTFRASTGIEQSAYDVPKGDSVLDHFPGESTTILQVEDGFIGFDSRTGAQKWRIAGHSRLNAGHVVADSGGVYASVDGHQVVRFSRETGERDWRYESVGVKAPVRVSMEISGSLVLVRGGEFVQALNSEDGTPLGRIECLSHERIHRVLVRGEALYALVKPNRNDSMWRLESTRLSRNEARHGNDKHFYLPAFPDFNEACFVGDTVVVHDGNRVIGFNVPKVSR